MVRTRKDNQITQPWTSEHDAALIRLLTCAVVGHRREIISDPAFVDVSDYGGSRVNAKLLALLRAHFGKDVVAVELAAVKGGRGKSDPEKASAAKANKRCKTSKKRPAPASEDEPEVVEVDSDVEPAGED